MPKMRHRTLRRLIGPRLKNTTTDAEKVRILRALYVLVYNSEESIIPLTAEIFHILGDILEGTSAEELPLRYIKKDRFLKTYMDVG